MKHSTRVVLGTLLIAAVIPASAAAATPPDNGAVNQYTETFPGPDGDQPTQGEQSPGADRQPPSTDETLGSENAERLEGLGSDGEAAAATAAKTTPPSDSGSQGGSGGPLGDSAARDPGEGSGFGEIIEQATGTSDSGATPWLLPLFILVVVVASGAFLWNRRRAG